MALGRYFSLFSESITSWNETRQSVLPLAHHTNFLHTTSPDWIWSHIIHSIECSWRLADIPACSQKVSHHEIGRQNDAFLLSAYGDFWEYFSHFLCGSLFNEMKWDSSVLPLAYHTHFTFKPAWNCLESEFEGTVLLPFSFFGCSKH
jgi:hypothetical protein